MLSSLSSPTPTPFYVPISTFSTANPASHSSHCPAPRVFRSPCRKSRVWGGTWFASMFQNSTFIPCLRYESPQKSTVCTLTTGHDRKPQRTQGLGLCLQANPRFSLLTSLPFGNLASRMALNASKHSNAEISASPQFVASFRRCLAPFCVFFMTRFTAFFRVLYFLNVELYRLSSTISDTI